jgi:hypothetical protein
MQRRERWNLPLKDKSWSSGAIEAVKKLSNREELEQE